MARNGSAAGEGTGVKQTLENIAAANLAEAQRAMSIAANALHDVGSPLAKQHAREMRGAIKMARTWELALLKIHAQKQRAKELE